MIYTKLFLIALFGYHQMASKFLVQLLEFNCQVCCHQITLFLYWLIICKALNFHLSYYLKSVDILYPTAAVASSNCLIAVVEKVQYALNIPDNVV